MWGLPAASLTSTILDLVAHHGAVAVFVLMAVDALLPVGGELIMLLAGALAAGALGVGAGGLGTGPTAYVALATAGALGYLAGAMIGWAVGRRGGRDLVVRHGRWLHLGPQRLERAERWFDRHGRAAVLLGRLTPIVRSFISIPAGVLGAPLGPYVALTLLGSAIWCFGFAAAGWALGTNWDAVHRAFGYAEVIAVAAIVGAGLWLVLRRGSRTA
jgi:membrane protein DedA with SNARE-associated domain